MPDFLSEKDWGAEIKVLKIAKDGGLKDALAEWTKAKGKAPDAQLDALEEVVKAAAAAQKLLKAEKDLVKFAATTETKAKAELARVEKESADGGEGAAVDKELYAALKRAKTAPMYAAVVAKGSTEGKLLLSKAKVKPAQITEAKKQIGGGAVYRAATVFEDGAYVFELRKEPPATLAQLIKKLAKLQTGLMIRVICRIRSDLEDLGEEPGEDADGAPAAASAPAAGPAAEYQKKLTLLTQLAKQALTEKRGDAALIARLLQSAQASAGAKDFIKALQTVESLENVLRKALAAKPATPAGPAAEYQKKLALLTPLAKKALTEKRGDTALIGRLFQSAQSAAVAKDFANGLQELQALQGILQQALAVAPAAAAGGTGPAGEYAEKLKVLSPGVKRVLTNGSVYAPQIKISFGAAQAAARSKQYQAALGKLTEVENLLSKALGATATGTHDLRAWTGARTAVISQLRKVQSAVLRSGFPNAKGVVLALESVSKQLTPEPASAAQVAELVRYLRDDDAITAVEEIAQVFGGGVRLRGPLLKALAQ